MPRLARLLAAGICLLTACSAGHAASATVSDRRPAKASCNPKLVLYWGQNSYGATHGRDTANWERRLSYYCRSGQVSNVIISFMNVFGKEKPVLDLSSHCDDGRTFPGTKIPDCAELREDVKLCQELGVKVELSLGGADGRYGFASDRQAIAFAEELHKMAFGGKGSVRPFGANSLDGINLDLENERPHGYAAFIRRLRQLQGPRGLLVTAAPQCPYPDASLHDVLVHAEVDAVYVQFYNNYCGMNAYGSRHFNFNTWAKWSQSVAMRRGAKVYLGVPGSAQSAGTGYASAARIKTAAQQLARDYPSVFGGVAVWDASTAYMNRQGRGNFVSAVHGALKGICSNAAAPSSATLDISLDGHNNKTHSMPMANATIALSANRSMEAAGTDAIALTHVLQDAKLASLT
ncbi:glycoside hydrolase superfamily [Syncephalis pseudoplumigaleata]|uniref:chitinase n=1 Tax=Syncephalis pseudoplumigaleata TaxID=1712513 RepID=A0A4P9Z428_9FUNG|nr:glycoside hydrolase superfamily [Syncephalis pseudoplumigaleata]|eukprot:RKP26300.1 glycoside hydrolase superfamily [Syncephalis pseudoplumigaleata]